jgi:hypothetical protein
VKDFLPLIAKFSHHRYSQTASSSFFFLHVHDEAG